MDLIADANPFDFRPATRVVFGRGALDRLGELALSAVPRDRCGDDPPRVLLVSDPGIVAAGHAQRGVEALEKSGLRVHLFDGVEENPTTEHVDRGVEFAREHDVEVIVGLGGGSSMDCAKGVNFVLTGGGKMADYWGLGKATRPMLPFIAVPTTAGTGSEAQSFALIADPITHQKMACGDDKAACRVAILDPELTATQPRLVAAATAIDAVSHAVETAATTKRTAESLVFSKEAWVRLERGFERAMTDPDDLSARTKMLIGAHLAGCAIEHSMLGAAHACANPLTARFDIVHGVAVGVMLPHVIRYNCAAGANPYAILCEDPETLVQRIEAMFDSSAMPKRLSALGVAEGDVSELASVAATQWTARFNPREVGEADLAEIYRMAL